MHRQLVGAIFNYGVRPSAYALPENPVKFADRRREPEAERVASHVAGGVDLVVVKAAMGHAKITTTERYLHARPATEHADRFTQVFASRADRPSGVVKIQQAR